MCFLPDRDLAAPLPRWQEGTRPAPSPGDRAREEVRMAVLLETSKGDLVIDLYVSEAPQACKNFLKLCKIKYYNNCLFHNVQRDFILQTGDPTGTGRGGESVNGVLYGEQARYFEDEIPRSGGGDLGTRGGGGRTHAKRGTVAMANAGKDMNASQFYITAGDNLDSLDGKHTIFGHVTEGLDVVSRINDAYCDEKGRPWQNIRIRHTIVLDDPYEDPPGLSDRIPLESPELVRGEEDGSSARLEDDWAPDAEERPAAEVEKSARKSEADGRAVLLEMIGDLPDAGARPEDNLIFVCKLNPVTTEEDLEIIFSRFGKVTCCDVVKDWKTGESLCYAFVGFETKEQAEQAYFKMDNVLIDDRRIHVDFYQSMYHQWRQHKRQEAGGRGTRGPGPARGAPPPRGRAPAQSWRQNGRLPPPQAPSRDQSRSPPTFRSPKGEGNEEEGRRHRRHRRHHHRGGGDRDGGGDRRRRRRRRPGDEGRG